MHRGRVANLSTGSEPEAVGRWRREVTVRYGQARERSCSSPEVHRASVRRSSGPLPSRASGPGFVDLDEKCERALADELGRQDAEVRFESCDLRGADQLRRAFAALEAALARRGGGQKYQPSRARGDPLDPIIAAALAVSGSAKADIQCHIDILSPASCS